MIRNAARKAAVVLVIFILMAAALYFDLGKYLTLSHIKESRQHYLALYAEKGPLVIAAYMTIYILVTALSLPGAAVMTLAGGALFGLWKGTLVVSFASSIGATIACFVSRFLLRDWVQSRFSDRIRRINEGVAREGTFYLFSLRLIPVFPFWLINIAMGLTPMRLATFYWVSQLGMLPATVVYVNAGKELAEIESARDILSLQLLGAFALLGLFPLFMKKAANWYRKRRS